MDYSPKLPIKFSVSDGNYDMISDTREEIKQNFKLLLLTSKGEKVCDYGFGVGLLDILFEQNGSDLVSTKVSEIYAQVERYLPVVVIDDIETNFQFIQSSTPGSGGSTNSGVQGWIMKVYYSVPEFGYTDFLLV